MSKRDYRQFAIMLGRLRSNYRSDESALAVLETVEYEMCKVFSLDNPRFDAVRFHDAVMQAMAQEE